MTRTAQEPQTDGAQGATSYASLSHFYRADETRVSSREQDVGLWWRERTDGPLHRAAWVADTGELYLVQLGAPELGGGRVEVLACVEDHELLESVLEGWREECGQPGSLSWLRERAARLGRRVRVAQMRMAAAVGAAGATLATAGVVAF